MRNLIEILVGLVVSFFATIFVVFGIIMLGGVLGLSFTSVPLLLLLFSLFLCINYFLYFKLPSSTESSEIYEKDAFKVDDPSN